MGDGQDTADQPTVRVTRPSPSVALITIARPPVNALDSVAQRQLATALRDAEHDLDVRAVVLAGDGRHFCAGADLREEQRIERSDVGGFLAGFGELLLAVRNHRVPVVAAVNGAAHGGGLELALACDIRVGSPTANFAAAGVNVGLVANFWSLAQAVGQARARVLLLTGWKLEADLARDWGVLWDVVPEDELVGTSVAIAERIATRAPLSVEATKRCLNQVPDLTEREATVLQVEEFSRLFRTADHAEALVAHFSKRDAVYRRL